MRTVSPRPTDGLHSAFRPKGLEGRGGLGSRLGIGLFGVLAFALLLSSCEGGTPAAGGPLRAGYVRHPMPAALASSGELSRTIALPYEAGLDVRAPEPILTIGSMSGSEVLGKVVDGAITSSGELLLLDQHPGKVLVYRQGEEGIWLRLGGYGDGPGEFKHAVAVAADEAGGILVADRALKIHRYTKHRAGWVYDSAIRVPFEPTDVCAVGARIFVAGSRIAVVDGQAVLSDATTIHEVSASGDLVNSFATPYQSDSRRAVQVYSEGRMACDPADGTISIAYSTLGEVHSYSLSGDLLWIAKLDPFVYPPLIQSPSGGIGPEMEVVDRIDLLSDIAVVDGGRLAVGFESRAKDDLLARNGEVALSTILLERSSGEVVAVWKGSSIVGSRNGHILQYSIDPFPRVELMAVNQPPTK